MKFWGKRFGAKGQCAGPMRDGGAGCSEGAARRWSRQGLWPGTQVVRVYFLVQGVTGGL